MNVIHLSTFDRASGAGIAAYRLHQGLRRVGIDSRMVVANKGTDDDTVDVIASAPALGRQLRRRLRSEVIKRQLARYDFTRPSEYMGYFSDDRSADPRVLIDALPKADVYHLHWITGFVDHRRFFLRTANTVPLVWTLHDTNPFTGGCHYTSGCDRFVGTCGACPMLGSTAQADLSAAIFRRKRRAYGRVGVQNVRVVTPSRWLSREASRSSLFSRFNVCTIPHGVDTRTFQPRCREMAREIFDIPQDLRIVMFAAQQLGNYIKGIDLLISVLKATKADGEIGVLSVGRGVHIPNVGHRHFHLGFVESERLLSFAYSAADLLVMPSREEAFGQVVLEAMACGTPVVAFNVGGIPDLVRPGITGLLVPADDAYALRQAVETVLADKELRTRFSKECRRTAVVEYRLELQAERYTRLYEELVGNVGENPTITLGDQPSTGHARALSNAH